MWSLFYIQALCPHVQCNTVFHFQRVMCCHAIGVQTGLQFLTLQESPLVGDVLAKVEKRNWMPLFGTQWFRFSDTPILTALRYMYSFIRSLTRSVKKVGNCLAWGRTRHQSKTGVLSLLTLSPAHWVSWLNSATVVCIHKTEQSSVKFELSHWNPQTMGITY